MRIAKTIYLLGSIIALSAVQVACGPSPFEVKTEVNNIVLGPSAARQSTPATYLQDITQNGVANTCESIDQQGLMAQVGSVTLSAMYIEGLSNPIFNFTIANSTNLRESTRHQIAVGSEFDSTEILTDEATYTVTAECVPNSRCSEVYVMVTIATADNLLTQYLMKVVDSGNQHNRLIQTGTLFKTCGIERSLSSMLQLVRLSSGSATPQDWTRF